MIDTFTARLETEQIPDNYKQDFRGLFTDFGGIRNKFGETETARFKNFGLMFNNSGISIYGSLSTYYLGTNQKTLRPSELIEAFNRLSEELSLPILKAKVHRVDLAENIILNQPANQYYTLLGDAKALKRLELDKNLTYRVKKKKEMVFYDKLKDLKDERKKPIDLFKETNVLRIENRYLSHREIVKVLGLATVTIEDIILHYPDLVNAWYDRFNSIEKHRDLIAFDPSVFNEKGLFDKQIKMMGVEAIGGIMRITELIKAAKKNKLFKYGNQSSNIVNRYKELMATPKLTVLSPLINELETKVKVAYFVNAERPQFDIV